MRVPIHVIVKEYYTLNPDGHYFDTSTMRFFKSRLSDYGYAKNNDYLFITSECGPTNTRLFTVRKLDRLTGDISNVGPFNELTKTQSRKLIAETLNYKIKDL